MHIKTVLASYKRNNPRTWPIIDDLIQTHNGSDYRWSKTPPAFLAYSQELMEDLLETGPMQRTKEKHTMVFTTSKLYNRFRDYPLNFDTDGNLRKYPHMTALELKAWRVVVTDLDAFEAENASGE